MMNKGVIIMANEYPNEVVKLLDEIYQILVEKLGGGSDESEVQD